METTHYRTILHQIELHTAYRQQCLNLIASENVMSPTAASVLSSDLANRYSVGRPNQRWFPGFEQYDEVEILAEKLAKKLFHAQYANLQAPTGMIANMAVYLAVLKPQDLVFSLSVKHSGHYSHVQENILSRLNIQVQSLPFDEKNYTVDVEKATTLIKRVKPKMIILGTSEFLFPAPVKELRNVCTKTGTIILYDASHVSGLIAGQAFQNPMAEGADLLTMSTNKTLAAPSHGIVACNNVSAYQSKIEQAIIPHLTSNHHAHHVAALAVTLAEFEIFGPAYAKQIIANAKCLARALHKQEITVLCPERDFTQSHTVLIDTVSDAHAVVRRLAENNIITNAFQLPRNSDGFASGIRIGTNELTRFGMKEIEMVTVAQLIADAMYKRKSSFRIKKQIKELRAAFPAIKYCFETL